MSSIRVTRTNTMNDDNKEEYECIEQIFHDPENENSRRWIWRKNLEMTRSDMRNSGFYANYVGSKGTRKHAANNDNSKAKPSHYLKHLVKIGCPHHDLKPIFENDLKFNVNPTICTHKSWKCGHNMNNFGQLIHELSMDEVGLEFKRSAYSIKPLLIKYGSSFMTKLFCKRIANTNFNKIFRPGSYGNSPSLKKGSWKDGKVFYVFKNDKLVLNIDNFINIVFELESPKTIINDNKNKHYIIDGWQNVVGGVGFYSPSNNNKKSSKHHTKSIETVLVFRKSMDFPKECLEQSKVKIYINNNADNRILNYTEKLIIGSKQLSLNVPPINQSMPILQQSSINNTSAGSMAYSSGTNSPVLLPSVSNSPSPLIDHDHIHSIPMPEQSMMITDGHLTNTFDADSGSVGQTSHSGSDMSIPCGGYGAHHGSSRSVQSYRYNPMQSINEEYHDQYVTNQDYFEIQDKLQKDNYSLNQQNQYLSTKVQSLTSLNKQFMEENDRLMQEKNELEQRIAMLQKSLSQQQQLQQQQLQSSQFEATEYMQLPQASQSHSSSQWMDNSTVSDGHMIQMNMNGNIHRNLNDNNKYHIADDYTMDYTMNNNINLNNNGNHHSQSYHHDEMNYNYVEVGQQAAVHNDYGLNISNPFINNNNNTNIYTPNGHQYQ